MKAIVLSLAHRLKLDPTWVRALNRFFANRRAHGSLVLLTVAFVAALGAELWVNEAPLLVRHHGQTWWPWIERVPGRVFDQPDNALVDWRALQDEGKLDGPDTWTLRPLVFWGANESDRRLDSPPPTPPSRRHWLGTDDRGRDLLARLVYGFRNSMLFALATWGLTVLLSFLVGATQGFFGGRYDFAVQRFSEIWSALPVLYVILFLLSLFPASLRLLTGVWVAFGWVGLSAYLRAETLRVRKLDYVVATRALGLGLPSVLFRHVLPNVLVPVVTFTPFLVASAIGGLAALDYLGLGLPPPAASWGELLRQGKENLRSWWLALFPFTCLFGTLCLLNFVGEGLRGAFDTRGR
jgi:microcin C transport system permease protein